MNALRKGRVPPRTPPPSCLFSVNGALQRRLSLFDKFQKNIFINGACIDFSYITLNIIRHIIAH